KARSADNPWPQFPIIHQVDTGQQDAISKFGKDPREFATTALEFTYDQHRRDSGVKSAEIKTIIGKGGEKIREVVPGTEKVWPAQLVLLAIGFEGAETENLGITTDRRSNIKVTGTTYQTQKEGV